MQLVKALGSSVEQLPNTVTTASYVSFWLLQLLPTPWGEIAPYFGGAKNSYAVEKRLSEMLKFPAREVAIVIVSRWSFLSL